MCSQPTSIEYFGMQARLQADGNLTYGEKDRNDEGEPQANPVPLVLIYITTTIHEVNTVMRSGDLTTL
jgi:hypothetical protein